MKTIKMLSGACALVCALTALSASVATAHEWLQSGIPLGKSVNVTQKASYKFGIGGFSYIRFGCEFEVKGTVGVGGKGEVTSVKEVKCYENNACQAGASQTVEAVHLPWHTELVTFEGGLGNKITTAEPEWKVKCKLASGENLTETCEIYSTASLKNLSFSVEETLKDYSKTRCLNHSDFELEGGGILEEKLNGIQAK
ncbi:MAG TPA: hypothetical protein VGL57_14610 [Solirubrobacteraceae bacterium]